MANLLEDDDDVDGDGVSPVFPGPGGSDDDEDEEDVDELLEDDDEDEEDNRGSVDEISDEVVNDEKGGRVPSTAGGEMKDTNVLEENGS